MVSLVVRLKAYLEPLILLAVALVFLPITILTHPFLILTSPSTFRSKWFENLWKLIGPKMAAAPHQVPYIEAVLSRARGVCLELGPGTGDQAHHFKVEKISRMYGAEPNKFLHGPLLAKAAEVGFGKGKYIALECGAQPASLLPALKRAGLLAPNLQSLPSEGIFDTIIAVKSLCSAPPDQMQATMAIVQALLKPGGEFVFFEHLHSDRDLITKIFVWFVNLGWPYIMGGCHLDGKLDKILMGMGGWAARDLKTSPEYQAYQPFRYAYGVCRKA
jgi:SAM-dependent methyltransferase